MPTAADTNPASKRELLGEAARALGGLLLSLPNAGTGELGVAAQKDLEASLARVSTQIGAALADPEASRDWESFATRNINTAMDNVAGATGEPWHPIVARLQLIAELLEAAFAADA